MRRRAGVTAIGLIVPLLILSALALPRGAPADASDVTVDIAIDVNTAGNGDNVLAPTESCNETPLRVGDTIDVDVVVRGIPAYRAGVDHTGISNFSFDLGFDPSVVEVTNVQLWDGPTILRMHELGGIQTVIYNFEGDDDPPGTTGDVRVELLPSTTDTPSGDGVLTRITLLAVGAGASRLDLRGVLEGIDTPNVYDAPFRGDRYPIRESDATVVVGDGTCRMATPTTFPFVTPGKLPGTGGPPGSAASGFGALALGAAIVLGAGVTAFAYARRRL